MLSSLHAAKPYASASSSPSSSSPSNSVASTVSFSKKAETVAVIGGGIAGLTCAAYLAGSDSNFQPTVFDTGRLRPGGRCSSRWPKDIEADNAKSFLYLKSTIIDHAAQILTAPDQFPAFQQQVAVWETNGIVTKYPQGTVCNIIDNKNYQTAKDGNSGNQRPVGGFALRPLNTANKPPMYYGSQGMASIPLAIQKQSQASLQQDVWVAPSNGIRYQKESGKWKLQAKGQTLGIFDRLVIAHNGKCADRIMSNTPAKQIHNLLKVNFAPRVPDSGGTRMTLNSIYSLTFALDKNTALDSVLPHDKFFCGFVQNEPSLRFLSCQTRKYAPKDNNVQVWTILSSAPFAKKYKAPQEFLPPDVIQNVTELLLQGLERSLYMDPNSIAGNVLESRLQLWGAAVPVNVWEPNGTHGDSVEDGGFLHDSEYGVGVCGDWLLESSIAGAWESGRRLAEYMKKTCAMNSNNTQSTKEIVGVEGTFRVSTNAMKAGIGSLTEG